MKKEKYLSDNEVVKAIREYIDNHIYNYAVLIDGQWGCGKTYFIKNILMKELSDHIEQNKNQDYKNIIYISLYGIKNTNEISKQIYVNVIDKTKENDSEGVKKIKSICSSGVKIFADVINNATGVNLLENINILDNFIDMSKYILIFDDLERCNCDINEVLGYINNFVEHDNVKVILVANEKEIGKCNELQNRELKYLLATNKDIVVDEDKKINQNQTNQQTSRNKITIEELKNKSNKIFNKNVLYEKIKEKLVGVTIKYRPDFEKVCTEMIESNILDNDLKNIILKTQEENIRFAYEKNHLNLRTFQFFLSKISKLNKVVKNSNIEDYNNIMSIIVIYCFKVSVTYKAGIYKNDWEDKAIYGQVCLGEKFSFKDYCFGFKFIDEYILYEIIDENEIEEIINRYEKEQRELANKDDDPIRNIDIWWEMHDEEVNINIEKIFEKVKNNEYSLSIYPKIIELFIELVNIGFDENIIDNMKDLMIHNIESNKYKDGRLDDYNKHFHGAKIKEDLLEKYKNIIKDIREKLDESKSKTKKITINEILEDKDEWGLNLYDYVYENYKYANDKNEGIFSVIDVQLLIDRIKKGNSYNIRYLLYTINSFYKDDGLNKYFIKDIENLNNIKNQISSIKDNEKDKIKKYALKDLEESLGEKINKLQKLKGQN